MTADSSNSASTIHEPELVVQTARGERRIKPVSQQNLWDKISRHARNAGLSVCEKALWLWYTARDPQTPAWAKRVAYGALAYFLLPIDTIPDFVPAVGFTDDLTALTAALGVIAVYVTPEVKKKSTESLKRWFG